MKAMLFKQPSLLWIPILVSACRLQAASTIQFNAATFTVAENGGAATVVVERTNDLNAVVTVDYATVDGTATAGLDYTSVHGTLNFAAGETNKTFTVTILNDGLVEPAETFQVMLSNPPAGLLHLELARPPPCASPIMIAAFKWRLLLIPSPKIPVQSQ